MTEGIIERAIQKDPEAFTRLMQEQMQSMYKTARQLLRSDEDIADAVQDTILTCWEKITQLREADSFRAWMMRILINKCYDRIRINGSAMPFGEVPEQAAFADYDRMEWEQLLLQIDEKYRIVLILYYLEGYRTGEISRILEIPEATVRTRLKRARVRLAEVYQGKRRA